jgi:hypothetical protein
MESETIDILVEEAKFPPETAVAVAKAVDMAITGAGLLTAAEFREYVADTREHLADAKVWAVLLYAALAITFFGALAADHHWLVSREDQLISQLQSRTDQRFEAVDRRFERVDQHFERIEARQDAIFDQLRTLSANVVAIQATLAKQAPSASRSHR